MMAAQRHPSRTNDSQPSGDKPQRVAAGRGPSPPPMTQMTKRQQQHTKLVTTGKLCGFDGARLFTRIILSD
jgi:hypothetical protein